uniref:Divalent cation transporter n=2 Tax=Macrostomum lignano TaxID=282301 RepID=A0A1I8H5I3_9PLAT
MLDGEAGSALSGGALRQRGSSQQDSEMHQQQQQPSKQLHQQLHLQQHHALSESTVSMALQMAPPLAVAGLGMSLAGLVLDELQRWPEFVRHPELLVMVPAIIGLKGNLEMTLASRLSTQAHLGTFNETSRLRSLVWGNLVLTQLQAVLVGFLAALVAILLNSTGGGGGAPHGSSSALERGLFLLATSTATASLASLLLGLVVSAVIVASERCRLNPDNLATPIAASLGDFASLLALAWLARQLDGSGMWPMSCLLAGYACLLPVLAAAAARNPFAQAALRQSWLPVLAAMLASSLGGLVFRRCASRLPLLALFQPVINGIGGNIAAIQASRLSTCAHRLPDESTADLPPACQQLFCGAAGGSRATRLLLGLVVPCHLLAICCVLALAPDGAFSISAAFLACYLAACLLQVAILLWLANWVVYWIWSFGHDPDSASIPYLTGVGDFLGAVLLAAAFTALTAWQRL